jgi:hypothetical protein
MKPGEFLRASFSLGWLAVVILGLASLLVVAAQNIGNTPAFDRSLNRMGLLNTLESEIAYNLSDMMRQEAEVVYNLEYGDDLAVPDANQMITETNAEIDQTMEDLEAGGYFDPHLYGSEILAARDQFNQIRVQHRQTFQRLVDAYTVKDIRQIDDISIIIEQENQTMTKNLADIVNLAELQRYQAQGDFPSEANEGLLVTSIGLILALLLALVGYLRISAATEPLGGLTNAIMAIGGGSYRPELLSTMIKRPGVAGDCARALDKLARGLTDRNASIVQQIDHLRQELFESRRRRLKIARPENDGGLDQ